MTNILSTVHLQTTHIQLTLTKVFNLCQNVNDLKSGPRKEILFEFGHKYLARKRVDHSKTNDV